MQKEVEINGRRQFCYFPTCILLLCTSSAVLISFFITQQFLSQLCPLWFLVVKRVAVRCPPCVT